MQAARFPDIDLYQIPPASTAAKTRKLKNGFIFA